MLFDGYNEPDIIYNTSFPLFTTFANSSWALWNKDLAWGEHVLTIKNRNDYMPQDDHVCTCAFPSPPLLGT